MFFDDFPLSVDTSIRIPDEQERENFFYKVKLFLKTPFGLTPVQIGPRLLVFGN